MRGNNAVTRSLVKRTPAVLLLCTLTLVAGCGTLPGGRTWGERATPFPGWKRVGRAAVDAAKSPRTWVPLIGAAAVQIDDGDERISRWASEHQPIFGSVDGAQRASDYLLYAAGGAYGITALATPCGAEPGKWVASKAKGLASGVAGILMTAGTVEGLQAATRRVRPDKSDGDSFPSGHTALATSMTTLALRNLDCIILPKYQETALRVGFDAISIGTGWARVEAQKHFPSDVLVGYALGHFLGAFFNDAFLGLGEGQDFAIAVEPSREGAVVSVGWDF